MHTCPWSHFTPDPFPFCEEQLCAIVSQPANTWSNVGYLIVAILIYRNPRFYCDKKYFASVCLALAIGSTLFHMSGALWAKILDVGAMLLLSSMTLSFTLRSRFSLTPKKMILVHVALCMSSFPLITVGKWGGIIFLIHCAICIVLEYLSMKQKSFMAERRNAMQKVALILPLALIINYMDQNGPLCWPSNHILTLHGIWHLLTAYVIYQVAVFYLLENPRKML